MTTLTRRFYPACAGTLYVMLAALLLGRNLQPALSQTGAAAESPKELYAEKCSACHNAYDPAEKAMTLTQWRRTVNRMLYKHGASDEISPAQTQTILTYLTAFAVPDTQPRRGLGAGIGPGLDNSDVWTDAPMASRNYLFGMDANLTGDLRAVSKGVAWQVSNASGAAELLLRAVPRQAGPNVLLLPAMKSNQAQEVTGLRIEAQFQAASAGQPVSFGLAFAPASQNGAKLYDVVRYDAKRGVVELVQTDGKQSQSLASASAAAGQLAASKSGGWQTLRVDILGSRVKAWLNYTKALDTTESGSSAGASVGIWTGSRAAVKSVTIDEYAAAPPAAVGNGT